ncbi:MAG: nitroreductase family protein [Oscillospiraceae bacterium]|nr:nitroreductase family protein [Oscillospiraceae bacterium]
MKNAPIDYKRWYDAADSRVSTRRFGGAPEADELERLELLAAALAGDGIRIKIAASTPKLFSGLMARSIKNAAYAALLVGKDGSPNVRAGYKGEALVLEATAMGLATCWIAGTVNRREARGIAALEEGESLLGVIAVGKPEQPLERIPDGERKRKPLEKLVQSEKGASLADILPWQNTALKCARIAPSAMNMQPWRFACAKDVICMVASGIFDKSAELDLGIAMLHIDLGAAVGGVRGSWGVDGAVWVFSVADADA